MSSSGNEYFFRIGHIQKAHSRRGRFCHARIAGDFCGDHDHFMVANRGNRFACLLEQHALTLRLTQMF